MGEAMASQNYEHTAELMKASLPYFDDRTRSKVELVSKIFDLMGSINIIGRESMAACGYGSVSIDVEGLLNGIRPICDHREREMVDQILNIFNAKRMFEMYNNFMNMMKTMQDIGGFSFGEEESKYDTDPDTVTGNFSDLNFDSIFRNFSQETGHRDEEEPQEAKNEHTSESNNSGIPNQAMFDMLKTMVPPEQQSTFDNLRMLFSTMSYDNNSKPDDHKEQKDG
jgi:hypothetical protein